MVTTPPNRLPDIWQERIILPSRFYAYVGGRPPWGISVDLLKRNPHLITLTKEIVVDKEALKAEERACEKLGWTSGEIYHELRKEGILKAESFKKDFDDAFRDEAKLRMEMEQELRELSVSPDIFSVVTQIDNNLLGPLSKSRRYKANAYSLQASENYPQPFWMKESEFWFDLFFTSDFFLIPEFPTRIKKIQNEVIKRQREPLRRLALLEIDYEHYQDEIMSLEKSLDEEIDKFIRNYRDSNGPYKNEDYSDKLQRILDYRDRMRGISPVLKEYRERYGEVLETSKTPNNPRLQKLKTGMRREIAAQRIKYMHASKPPREWLRIAFGAPRRPAGILTRNHLGEQVRSFYPLFHEIGEFLRARRDNPLGVVKVSLEEETQRRKKRKRSSGPHP
jgi:hypothetical protein